MPFEVLNQYRSVNSTRGFALIYDDLTLYLGYQFFIVHYNTDFVARDYDLNSKYHIYNVFFLTNDNRIFKLKPKIGMGTYYDLELYWKRFKAEGSSDAYTEYIEPEPYYKSYLEENIEEIVRFANIKRFQLNANI